MRGPERRQQLFQQLDSLDFDLSSTDDDVFDECDVTTTSSTSSISSNDGHTSAKNEPQSNHHEFRRRLYRQLDEKNANLANMLEVLGEVAREETDNWIAQLLEVCNDIRSSPAYHTESVPLWFAPRPKSRKSKTTEAKVLPRFENIIPNDEQKTKSKEIKKQPSKPSSNTPLKSQTKTAMLSKTTSVEPTQHKLNTTTSIPKDTTQKTNQTASKTTSKPKDVTPKDTKSKPKETLSKPKGTTSVLKDNFITPKDTPQSAQTKPKPKIVTGASVKNQLQQFEKFKEPKRPPPRALCVDGTKQSTSASTNNVVESHTSKFTVPKTPTLPSPAATRSSVAPSKSSDSPRPIKGSKINAMAQFFENLE
ncbi:hypothetical protein DIURU_000851 [Diutina rugosa]|uniref:Uncharacterized protein n=1 Tax=Diutina rugosa TaxID=5481 RepID=A0A642UX71_DIURU|nr:uncharacterized protein DIURU_000851 [Diutina rugosa]KAA8907167.1 hypothetical protein DIURU_000851 [Diutina rugosa]